MDRGRPQILYTKYDVKASSGAEVGIDARADARGRPQADANAGARRQIVTLKHPTISFVLGNVGWYVSSTRFKPSQKMFPCRGTPVQPFEPDIPCQHIPCQHIPCQHIPCQLLVINNAVESKTWQELCSPQEMGPYPHRILGHYHMDSISQFQTHPQLVTSLCFLTSIICFGVSGILDRVMDQRSRQCW
jgi:hypothetical protein